MAISIIYFKGIICKMHYILLQKESYFKWNLLILCVPRSVSCFVLFNYCRQYVIGVFFIYDYFVCLSMNVILYPIIDWFFLFFFQWNYCQWYFFGYFTEYSFIIMIIKYFVYYILNYTCFTFLMLTYQLNLYLYSTFA